MKLQYLSDKFKTAGLKDTEAKIYASITLRGGRAGSTDIASDINTTSSNVSMAVRGLIKKNLVAKDGAKFVISNPSAFVDLLQKELHENMRKVDEQKRVITDIADILTQTFSNLSGKPIVKTLNYDQWKEFEENWHLKGEEKTIRLFRSHRYQDAKEENIKISKQIYKNVTESNIKYEVLTPFLDKKDKNNENITYYNLEASDFDGYDIDLIIKDDTISINYRALEEDVNLFDVIIIQNKKIAIAFKKIFDYITKTVKK